VILDGRDRIESLRERGQQAGGLARVRAELASDGDDPAGAAALALMTDGSLDADLASSERLLDRAADAMTIADVERARIELMRLDEANRRGDHGSVARRIVAPLAPAYERVSAVAGAMAAQRVLLARIARGDEEPARAANAAAWYRRAAEQYEAIDRGARRRIADLAADPASSVDARIKSALDAARGALDMIDRAAALDRCDFWAERPDHPAGAAAYHASMRGLVDAALADARRAIGEGRYGDAVARLARTFHMAGHLASDGALVSALLAQETFERVSALLAPGLRADLFSEAQRTELHGAARRVGTHDPFGYAAAAAAERAALARWIEARFGPLPVDVALRLEATMEQCSDDQILMMALSAGRMETESADSVQWLLAALPPRDPRPLERHAARLRAMLEEGRLDGVRALDESAAPLVTRLSERRAAARSTVRDALAEIRGTEVAASAE
jgi:hypothetical protein